MTKLQKAFNDGVKYEMLHEEMFDIMGADLYLKRTSSEWKLKHKRYFKCLHKAKKILWTYTKGR